MATSYLPIESFDIEQVDFYVIEVWQYRPGLQEPFYNLLGSITGKPVTSIELVAMPKQLAGTSMTASWEIEKYGNKYLQQVKKQLQGEGYIVKYADYSGIIHEDNLNIVLNDPQTRVWEFLANKHKSKRG